MAVYQLYINHKLISNNAVTSNDTVIQGKLESWSQNIYWGQAILIIFTLSHFKLFPNLEEGLNCSIQSIQNCLSAKKKFLLLGKSNVNQKWMIINIG